ncbi:MAG: sodium-dependent transporter [Eggerthellales bacterium]|nr:sodium-dependent transporter [Eggerthellales bacterium]
MSHASSHASTCSSSCSAAPATAQATPAAASAKPRDRFSSRLGFLLISAGCAVGLGNVWRFPYITGENGGAAFVLIYILFLVIFAMPILVMEFAIGRGSQKGIGRAFDELEPQGTKWHWFKWVALAGNYLLMMFYTVVAGWMLAFTVKSAQGVFVGMPADQVSNVFAALLANPTEMLVYLIIVVAVGMICTAVGLQNGVERVTKVMMAALFVVLIVLCVRAVTLPGSSTGLQFYLMPNFGALFSGGLGGFASVVYDAMGQAFFTMSLGIGSMLIFGSYVDKDYSLPSEALRVGGIDTLVALMAGLIIFPACFAFGVEPGSGPGLVFITLPGIFEMMPGGQIWCTLFFLFMSCAALSTVIAVFENIMSFSIDNWNMSRKKSVLINGSLIFLLSLPCLLGFNLWSGFTIPGIGDIQGLEDFIISNNILPIGGLIILLFCTHKKGWGFKNFLAEADAGKGIAFPRWIKGYLRYVLPILILVVLIGGWIPVVSQWVGLA